MTEQNNNETDEQRALRNSIFAARQAVEQAKGGGVPQQQASGQSGTTSNLGFEIPVGVVPLPSLGLVYGNNSPLHNSSEIHIKAMTTREEDILMSKPLIKNGTVITELLKSCMINKSTDVNEMLSGDRNAVMVAVRISGYGSEYQTSVTCPACELKQEHTFALTELPIKELDLNKVKQVEPFVNLFEFQLPMTNKQVFFKFLTGKDETQILKALEVRKKSGFQIDNLVTTRLMACVQSIDSKEDKNWIGQFIRQMPARDSLALRHHIDAGEPGIEMKQNFICNSCAHEEEVAVNLDSGFFWPGKF